MQCTCTYEHVTLENNKNQQVDRNIIHKYVTNKKKMDKTIWILYLDSIQNTTKCLRYTYSLHK